MTSFFYRCVLLALLAWAELTQPVRAQGSKPKPRPALPVPYQAVDARMRQVPDSSARTVGGLARFITASFPTEGDRARAAFVWVARHIRYDVDNMFVLEYEREPAVVVQETLDQRRGVCRHYAELYAALANQVGVLTYVVPGYTSLRDAVGHAWCASRIAGQWQLLDPTWAAGRVENNRFVCKLNNDYFRVAPKVFIGSHMPFDPLWQLLPAPRTPQQFQQGLTPAAPHPAFAFADSVAMYTQQSAKQRLRATNRRIEQNGVKSGLIFTHLANNRSREENLHLDTYNAALSEYNQAAAQFNAFIDFFNRQFQPRQTDAELRLLLPPVLAHIGRAQELMAAVHTRNPAHLEAMRGFETSLREAETKLHNYQAFLDRYLSTNKLLRPALFMNFSTIGGRNEMMR
ncbi:transglutaminase domain-containing protein [Hymenobacter fastidiosus]